MLFRFIEFEDRESHTRKWTIGQTFKPKSAPMIENSKPLTDKAGFFQVPGTAQMQPALAPAPQAAAAASHRQAAPQAAAAAQSSVAVKEEPGEAATPVKRKAAGQALANTRAKPSPSPEAAPDDIAKSMRVAEAAMKQCCSALSSAAMQSAMIKNNVDTVSSWAWVGHAPAYTAFVQEVDSLEQAKLESPMIQALLLNGCDLGHLCSSARPFASARCAWFD